MPGFRWENQGAFESPSVCATTKRPHFQKAYQKLGRRLFLSQSDAATDGNRQMFKNEKSCEKRN